MQFTKLSEKAMLVKLTQRKPALTKRDVHLTANLQKQEGDRSLTVFKRLFIDRASPINQIMAASAEVYGYHKLHTLPYIDAGPRLLPNGLYFEYTQEMRQLMSKVEGMLTTHMPHYAQYVQEDIKFRNGVSGAARATASEYPTAEEFSAAMRNDLRFMPMPDKRHFLFDLADEDVAEFDKAEAEAVKLATTATIEHMIKPIEALVTKLTEYQGEKGQRFHNSVVENVIEGCRRARKLAIDPPQDLLDQIDQLEDTAAGLLRSVETLKGSPHMRASAKTTLDAAARKFNDYFG